MMEVSSRWRKASLIGGGLLSLTALILAAGCTGPRGETGPIGTPGVAGANGATGPAGAVGKNGTAGKAGPVGPVGPVGPTGAQGAAGPRGDAGPQGVPGGVDPGMNVDLSVSGPPTGRFFATGQKIVVTITLNDAYNGLLTRDDFSTLALYMYGPQEPTKTVTAVKLLHTTDNRSAAVHHYIDLLSNNSSSNGTPDLKIDGNVLTYTLQSITDELPGTYSIAVRAVKKGPTTINQAMVISNLQIGTATPEQQTVNLAKCGPCHQGASNNQIYMHHVDGSAANPLGSFSIDNGAIATCKACHNNNGYASYVFPAGSSTRVSDQIVNRVHGLHMGEGLQLDANNNPVTGAFKDYIDVVFPQDVRNCTACHTNDNWKTKPSRLACGTCHDNTWFGDQNAVPAGYKSHAGGIQIDDSKCTVCHTSDTGPITSAIAPIPTVHKVSQPLDKIDISMTKPANGQFYVAGEKPVVTAVIRNDNGTAVDHSTLDSITSTANLYVYGPREQAKPVLTNVAAIGNTRTRASATNTIAGPWTFVAGDTFKVSVNDGPVLTLAAPVGIQTPAQVATWLGGALGTNVTVTATTANMTTIQDLLFGDASKIDIYNSAVTDKMGWKPAGLPIIENGVIVRYAEGTTMEPYQVRAAVSTVAVNMRTVAAPGYTDPGLTKSQGSVSLQLLDVKGLQPGTYMVFSYVIPNGVLAGTGSGPTGAPNAAAKSAGFSNTGIGFMTFQVGTATPDKKVATNCNNCHGSNIWHLDNGPIHPEPFDTDYCLACHDYGRMGTGEGYSRTGGTSTNGWAGYGAKPLVARLHGVHFGAYLNRPEDVYAGNAYEFAGIILPQDVRNCTKCHSADTTGTWKTAPSKLACLSCHDSDAARTHGKVNTAVGPSGDPLGVDSVETCNLCHGPGKEFAPEVVHDVANPYVPPYPRSGWKIGQ
jgi:hypothetical protein